MELEFMELEFHKKRYYRDLKRHYRASYGAIKLKKNLHVLKCHNRVLKRHYRAPYGAIKLKKKLVCFKMLLEDFKKLHGRASYGAIKLKKKKNLHVLKCHYKALKNCIELEFIELKFQYFILFFFNFQFVLTQSFKNRVLK